MRKLITIIIPTFNNPQYLNPCVESILSTGILNGFAELVIVNNGSQPCDKEFAHLKNVRVLKPASNLGWEGGLKLGLESSESDFVVFMNDDVYIPFANSRLFERLLLPFSDPSVAAVGPTTTVAAGHQSIFYPIKVTGYTDVNWLIFFTVMVRRKHVEEAGGIDTTLPGGDDFDLSIRLRNLGYRLLIAPDAFLIHHGFKTGERVHGTANVEGGWNSRLMTERTNKALIQKHGFKNFFRTISRQIAEKQANKVCEDLETPLFREFAIGTDILELGCGPKKAFVNSTGVDIVPNGEVIKEYDGRVSVADVVWDVTKPLPFDDQSYDTIIASHVLEHCLDTVTTLRSWIRTLKFGGRLLLTCPDESVTAGIPLNPEHCHAFTKESIGEILALLGMKEVFGVSTGNGISFFVCYEKCEIKPMVDVETMKERVIVC